jgi:AmiR/NasT family two-component response regulator
MEAGATAYILKPLSPHHIKMALRDLFRQGIVRLPKGFQPAS